MRLIIFFASLLFATSRAQTAGDFCENVTFCDNASFCNYENSADGVCVACEDVPESDIPCGSGCAESQGSNPAAATSACQRKCEFALPATAETVTNVEYVPAPGDTVSPDYDGICSFIGNPLGSQCPGLSAGNSCVEYKCTDVAAGNNCLAEHEAYGTTCESTKDDKNGVETQVPGLCIDGECVFTDDLAACPDAELTTQRTFDNCPAGDFDETFRIEAAATGRCIKIGESCQDTGPSAYFLICASGQTINDPDHEYWRVQYEDQSGRCIIGAGPDDNNPGNCIISEPGRYTYAGMEIYWSAQQTSPDGNFRITNLQIPLTTMVLIPKYYCDSGACRGTGGCDFFGPYPCGGSISTCGGSYAPTLSPSNTQAPQVVTTLPPSSPPSSPQSFGDPIIWTFDGDCYDLNIDGTYLASSHKFKYNHDVHISIHNHYMRDITVTNKETGEVMLAINNLGNIINNDYPYYFEERMVKCQVEDECDLFYKEYVFDAQQFEYIVQILPHSYDDLALSKGESGMHLDIYPHPYSGFQTKNYNGLYVNNPIPNESGVCVE